MCIRGALEVCAAQQVLSLPAVLIAMSEKLFYFFLVIKTEGTLINVLCKHVGPQKLKRKILKGKFLCLLLALNDHSSTRELHMFPITVNSQV